MVKVKEFYATSIHSASPVPGAVEGVQELHGSGYKLVVVTARHSTEYERTKDWLERFFPSGSFLEGYESHSRNTLELSDKFDKLICTNQFQTDAEGRMVNMKVGKAEV